MINNAGEQSLFLVDFIFIRTPTVVQIFQSLATPVVHALIIAYSFTPVDICFTDRVYSAKDTEGVQVRYNSADASNTSNVENSDVIKICTQECSS